MTRSRSGKRVNRQERTQLHHNCYWRKMRSIFIRCFLFPARSLAEIHLQSSKITFGSQTYQPTLIQHLVPFVLFVLGESRRATSTPRQA